MAKRRVKDRSFEERAMEKTQVELLDIADEIGNAIGMTGVVHGTALLHALADIDRLKIKANLAIGGHHIMCPHCSQVSILSEWKFVRNDIACAVRSVEELDEGKLAALIMKCPHQCAGNGMLFGDHPAFKYVAQLLPAIFPGSKSPIAFE